MSSIWIACLFVFARRVIGLLASKFIEQQAVYSMGVHLWDASLLNGFKRLIKRCAVVSCVDFIDKRNILSARKDELELFICGFKDVIDAVDRTVDDLNVLHVQMITTSAMAFFCA